MRDLGKSRVLCKPLIPQIKTTVLPQKQTRMADTGDIRCRLGDSNISTESYHARHSYRVGPYRMFSGSDEEWLSARSQSGTNMSRAETMTAPRLRRGEPMKYLGM